ncbi:hypothetical protein U1701_11025 [Sphingomonas sp. PB2P19]|uniref:hypothetical protein n=1 Tax=Sphingomonas rhamnosi TaxID=3096156 RepID=UPI002FCC54BD
MQPNRFVAHAARTPSRSRGVSQPMARAQSWAAPFTAEQRALVVLIENGGIDLELGTLVDMIADRLPAGGDMAKAALRPLAGALREKIRAATDTLLESAELALNRYSAARPDQYDSVTVLRDGTATYAELKTKLIDLSRAQKIVDLIILTHGGTGTISLKNNITAQMVRDMRTDYGKPLQIRSVYMMNCKGSSLNQAWLDAGAKTACGTIENNYLPEPTTYFFWKNWRAGQSFQAASTNAYRATIKLMNDAINGFIGALPGLGSLIPTIDVATFDFVAQSAPVVSGQGNLVVSSDDISFTQSVSGSLATTVVPLSLIGSQGTSPSGQRIATMASYVYENEDRYARQQNPVAVVIAGIEIADALQIGLGAAAMVQAGVSGSAGSFTLNYDRAQRLLTNEARQAMPGANQPKSKYTTTLFKVGMKVRPVANAVISITWEGNAFGEIGTVVIERDLDSSSDWSKSDFRITISRLEPIPDKSVDPRAWPLVFTYTGSYDPVGNGQWEFSGEFEINAFGTLRFNRHKVVSRALWDGPLASAEEYVERGATIIKPIPTIPPEQVKYLKDKLP